MSKRIQPSCTVVIATSDRWRTLIERALPSIRRQLCSPRRVIVVNDGDPFSVEQERRIRESLVDIPFFIARNRRTRGAAGAWNTGLEHALSDDDGFVALLDDDDEWDPTHLLANVTVAQRDGADVVVSGLRLVIDGREHSREPPTHLTAHDFLIGNPGWQGSNTFMSQRVWKLVGGFRDGMRSLNDRDLAIRVLRCSGVSAAYPGMFTATWHITTGAAALSLPGSAAKLSGLRWFWAIYGHEMTERDAESFFARTERLFAISRTQITAEGADLPPHRHARGDLIAAR